MIFYVGSRHESCGGIRRRPLWSVGIGERCAAAFETASPMRSTDAAADRNAGAERRHTVGCSMHLLRMPAGTHAPPGSRSPHSRAAAFTSASLRNVITATLLDRA